MREVVMIGLGYIGLPTAAVMSNKGIKVLGIDVVPEVVDTINQGKIHIVEPGLEDLVNASVQAGNLQASLKVESATNYLIAVPTPFKGDYVPDLKYVESAIDAIIPVLEQGQLVVIESTSPVNTTEWMYDRVIKARPELEEKFYMAYCPERVLPGNVIFELENNDRVIGGLTEEATKKAQDFYGRFVKGELHHTNSRTAEMCKLVENASRDSQIAFANELSMICDKADINVYKLIELTNKHPRVNILQPGTGVGGHCIAVDPWFIVSAYPDQAKFVKQAREINNYKTDWVIERIKSAALEFQVEKARPAKIACLGLAFKPDIDDLRESPAVKVVDSLSKWAKAELLVVEPNVHEHKKYDLVAFDQAMKDADILVILVAHKEFKVLDSAKNVFDFCGATKKQLVNA
jgi:UDP-N-acetyl-D-mannosaminuronic acid dehydrogenase